MLLGYRPFVFANDAALPLCMAAWWCAHYCPGKLFLRLNEFKAVQCFLAFIFEVTRTNVILIWLNRAHIACVASKYYSIPIWGPIISGTVAGCFGSVSIKGLDLFKTEMPWLVQGAFYASVYYHLMVYDPNVKSFVDDLDGDMKLSGNPEIAHVTCSLFLGLTLMIQTLIEKPDFNPFAPVHQVLYKVTNISCKDKKLKSA